MANLFDLDKAIRTKNEHLKTHVPPEVLKNAMEEIKNFKVKESDVILIGYPRSGTTWTQELVWLIANDLDFEGAKVFIGERFPILDVAAFNLKESSSMLIPDCYIDSIKILEKMKDPRFYKAHLKPSLLPQQILTGEVKPKIIFVQRNVKDVCLSSYHFLKNLGKLYTGNLEQYCNYFVFQDSCSDLSFETGNYWDGVLYFWNRRHEDNILFIKYEEIKSDMLGAIRQVAKFLEKTLTEDQEAKLVEWLSFEHVKNNPALNHNDIYKKSGFIRKGIVGSHKTEMTSDLIKKFDAWSKECVKGTDFKL